MSGTRGREWDADAQGGGSSRRRFLRLAGATGLAAFLVGGIASRMYRDLVGRRITATRMKMGTPVTMILYHGDEEEAERAIEVAFGEIDRVEAIFSRYLPESPVSRLARNGVVSDAPPELIELLRRSERFSELTEGAFDITVAPLLDLYRARTDAGGALPTDDEIADALALVDYRRVEVRGRTVTLGLPLMAITLDAIAKGYAADRALTTLAGLGIGRAMVEAGGDISATVAADASLDEGWEVAIQDPRRAGGSLGILRLVAEVSPDGGSGTGIRGVATSGDYMNAFTPDRSIHHIIDPRTGRSPTELSSATVVAPSGTEADALATSTMVMGREAGLALLEEQNGVEGLLVTRNGQILRTTGFPAV